MLSIVEGTWINVLLNKNGNCSKIIKNQHVCGENANHFPYKAQCIYTKQPYSVVTEVGECTQQRGRQVGNATVVFVTIDDALLFPYHHFIVFHIPLIIVPT